MNKIVVENLTKVFKTKIDSDEKFLMFNKKKNSQLVAVNNVSFEINEGEFVGFIGPNGAGKTTTLKMLSGILVPTSGLLNIFGYEPSQRKYEFLRTMSIVMGQKSQINIDLPAMETFDLHRVIYKVDKVQYKKKVNDLIEMLDLKDKVKIPYKKLSLGEKMKCELILSLIHSPKIMFLDEPTIGLDIVAQKSLRDFLRKINKEEGTTILLTSHYMDDVESLCPRVIVINHGSKIYDGNVQSLINDYATTKDITFTLDTIDDLKTFVDRYNGVEFSEITPAGVKVSVKKDISSKLVKDVLEKFEILDIGIADKDLEDIIRDIYEDGNVKVLD